MSFEGGVQRRHINLGGATPLGCLRGVQPEQAVWKPAPDRHSIWELVLHIAYWKYAVRRNLEGSPLPEVASTRTAIG